jgi:hypothetical protein
VTSSSFAVHARHRESSTRQTALLQTVLWGWTISLAVLIASAAGWSIRNGAGDWRVFAAAGARVGTPELLNPPEAWQSFFYLPGVAWALAPFAHVPLTTSFLLNAFLMLACAAVAGVIAARTYGLDRATAVALYAFWSPVIYAVAIIGQNAPFGLLLAQIAIAGMVRGSVVLTAIPIGLLLYKPTYAVPMIGLLVARARWRELAIVGAMASMWYGFGVTATGGDWDWPTTWSHLLTRFAAGDLSVNAPFAVSLPALLVRTGTSVPAVACMTAIVALVAAVPLRRAPAAEAGSAVCLIGLALSPHAWAYDAGLALPMIGCAAATLADPGRTRLLLALSLVVPLFFASRQLGFDPLAVVVIGGALAWLASRSSWTEPSRRTLLPR